jgi:hypothetical protein
MRHLALAALVAASACRTLPRTPPHVLAALEVSPGAHLVGRPAALGEPLVLNREDFVYDAKPSPDGRFVALSRLGLKAFHLTLHDVRAAAPARIADVSLNPIEFDVEAVEFSPDGAAVATASRDGALRVFSVKDGTPLAAWLTEEPLTALAWSRDGTLLALGSARGLVTLVAWPTLAHLAEVRAHADEVRGLAFTPEGELVSAGWDRVLRVFAVSEVAAPVSAARTRFTKKNGNVLFRAVVDRAASALLALDARAPAVVLRPALAQAVGIDVLALTESVTVPGPLGS